MDERMKILQMLEDGKITADEAAKLLEAVSRHRPRRHTVGVDSEVVGDVMDGVSGVMESIPGIIAEDPDREEETCREAQPCWW